MTPHTKELITIVTSIPGRSREPRYYLGYVDHMWRLYASHLDAVPYTANTIDRNDWSICNAIYSTLQPLEQSLILARYQTWRNDNTTGRNDNAPGHNSNFSTYCDSVGISETSAVAIISAIVNRTAEDRGLIGRRSESRAGTYRMSRKAEDCTDSRTGTYRAERKAEGDTNITKE